MKGLIRKPLVCPPGAGIACKLVVGSSFYSSRFGLVAALSAFVIGALIATPAVVSLEILASEWVKIFVCASAAAFAWFRRPQTQETAG